MDKDIPKHSTKMLTEIKPSYWPFYFYLSNTISIFKEMLLTCGRLAYDKKEIKAVNPKLGVCVEYFTGNCIGICVF